MTRISYKLVYKALDLRQAEMLQPGVSKTVREGMRRIDEVIRRAARSERRS